MTLPPLLRERLRLPVIGSPMFLISQPDLVIAQCKAGVVGSFLALNARPAPALEEWLQRITTELAAWDAAHPEAPSAPAAVGRRRPGATSGAAARGSGRSTRSRAWLISWRAWGASTPRPGKRCSAEGAHDAC